MPLMEGQSPLDLRGLGESIDSELDEFEKWLSRVIKCDQMSRYVFVDDEHPSPLDIERLGDPHEYRAKLDRVAGSIGEKVANALDLTETMTTQGWRVINLREALVKLDGLLTSLSADTDGVPCCGPWSDEDGPDEGLFQVRASMVLEEVRESVRALSDGASRTAAPATVPATQIRDKRSTVRGEATAKIPPALIQHHRYDNGSCLNYEPIRLNKFARKLGIASSVVSDFLRDNFRGYSGYRAACLRGTELCAALRLLNGDFLPRHLLTYGRTPPGEGGNSDDD